MLGRRLHYESRMDHIPYRRGRNVVPRAAAAHETTPVSSGVILCRGWRKNIRHRRLPCVITLLHCPGVTPGFGVGQEAVIYDE